MDTLAIVGVGLMGGSIGIAAKTRGIARHIIGVAKSAEYLGICVDHGAIDAGTTDAAAAILQADLTIICT
ncbi:MAG: prephenate dehydrogenase, partial [Gemmataceae bacterium]